jgi:hypothetical protein
MPLRIISLKLVVRAARITRRRFYIALNIPAQREASQNRVTTGLGMPGIAPQYRFFHHRAPLCSAAQPFGASGIEFGNGGRFRLLSRMRIRRAFFTSAVNTGPTVAHAVLFKPVEIQLARGEWRLHSAGMSRRSGSNEPK